MNNVTLIGRLTRDPELRKTTNGKSVVSFNLAVNRKFKNGDQDADFINCVAWEKTAEFMGNYLKKGALVSVVGSIQSRTYDDNQTGKKVYVQEVVTFDVQALESKSQRDGNGGNAYENTHDDGPVLDITSDDLPF